MRAPIVFSLALTLVACANPINRNTYLDYKQQGARAEAQGDWAMAETAYYRAAENARWGNLPHEVQSTALFDLGRAQRKNGKLAESEEVLQQTLAMDEKLQGADSYYASMTIAELAAVHYEAKNYQKGLPLLLRLEPLLKLHSSKYTPQARHTFKQMFGKYADVLVDSPEGERLRKVAGAL